MIRIHHKDNWQFLINTPDSTYDLIYIDPPFNTGKRQIRTNKHGEAYGYDDQFDDFQAFIIPRLHQAYRVLKPTGSFFIHMDYREIHYVKIILDGIFGRDSFINEIIWSYDYGARSKKRWSCKHDNILWYAKDPDNYTFNYDAIDRIPYLAPSLCGAEKAERGKTPTDVWWNTIVSPNGKEKTGYATQKPLNIMNRIVQVHSNKWDNCLDFFAGSGSFGEACKLNHRNCDLVDINEDAIKVMRKRLGEPA